MTYRASFASGRHLAAARALADMTRRLHVNSLKQLEQMPNIAGSRHTVGRIGVALPAGPRYSRGEVANTLCASCGRCVRNNFKSEKRTVCGPGDNPSADKRPMNGRFSFRSYCMLLDAQMEFGRDAMTTATNALRKLVRSHHGNPVHLDARILRDIGLSRVTVEFAALR